MGFSNDMDHGNFLGFSAGIIDNQLRYSRYLPETVAFEPLGTFSYQDDFFFLQLAFGPSFAIPTSKPRKTDPALLYEVQAGVRIQDFMAVGVGFKGQHIFAEENEGNALSHIVTEENEGNTLFDLDFSNQYSLDINARLFLGKLSPVVRLSVPLEGPFKKAMDVSVMAGALYEF